MLKNKLPNSKNCFACGLENPIGLRLTFYAQPDGSVEGHYAIAKRYESYPGMAHGGIVASILDEALTRVFMVVDHNRFTYTGKLTIRLRKHVPVERPLRITAHAIKDRGRASEAKAQILDAAGNLLAEGEGLMIALPPEDLERDLQELGWRVYPD